MRDLLWIVVLAAAGCGNSAAPSTPATPASTDTSAPTASGTPDVASAAPSSTDPPKKQRPLEIKNSCHNVVTIVFGEDPSAAGAGKRTLAGDSSIDGPRDAEGKVTVSLLDEKSEKVATVHVTRGMKRVEVGASCRTLDAR